MRVGVSFVNGGFGFVFALAEGDILRAHPFLVDHNDSGGAFEPGNRLAAPVFQSQPVFISIFQSLSPFWLFPF